MTIHLNKNYFAVLLLMPIKVQHCLENYDIDPRSLYFISIFFCFLASYETYTRKLLVKGLREYDFV